MLRRPDGNVIIPYRDADSKSQLIMLVIEVDESQHRGNTPLRELKRRLEAQIQDRHLGPVFVVRFNSDQKDGLGAKLDDFVDRCARL